MWSWQQTQSTEELVERGEFGSLSHCSLVMDTCTVVINTVKFLAFNPHTHVKAINSKHMNWLYATHSIISH